LVVAIKKSAELVKTDKVPPGGFTEMFEKAMSVGHVLDGSKTLAELRKVAQRREGQPDGDTVSVQGRLPVHQWPNRGRQSSLVMQIAILAALGKPVFGIPFTRPLTALILQNENDNEDILEEVSGVLKGLNLSEAEAEQR